MHGTAYSASVLAADGRRKCTQVCGPLGARALSMDDLGWSSEDGPSITDSLVIRRAVTGHTLGLWKRLVKEAVLRCHETELGFKTGSDEVRGKLICWDIVRRAHTSTKVEADGRAILAVASCKALRTRTRAWRDGDHVERASVEMPAPGCEGSA